MKRLSVGRTDARRDGDPAGEGPPEHSPDRRPRTGGFDWWVVVCWIVCAVICIAVWYLVWKLAAWALGRMLP